MGFEEETHDLEKERERLQQEILKQRQLGFAIGLFQEEVTIRALLESLAQAVIVIDKFSNILLVNKRAELMFGYKSTEIVGKPHNILVPERFRKIHEQHMSGYFEEPRVRPMGIGMDLFGLRGDGTEFPVEISLSYVNTVNGIIVLALVSDITIRKQAEERYKKRAEELAEANRNLESFSYSVSHDLKAPLQALMGFSQILLEDYADKHDKTANEYLNRIGDSARQMSTLIDDLLKLSRITLQEMVVRDTNLSQVAGAIVNQLQSDHPDRNVEIVIKENIHATVDEKLFNVALSNLLGNAWKFTAKTPGARIEFGTLQKDGQLIYFVKDNGAGFDMSHSERLFVPFQRLHSDREFKGTGVGLSIVERVIKRHGGKIWAEGETGKGATFFFTIRGS